MRARRLISVATVLVASGPAMAQDWEWSVAPYLWGSDMSVDARIRERDLIQAEQDFSDLVDKLDFAIQIHFEGRKGRAGFFGDFTYLETSDRETLPANPPLPGGTEIRTEAETILF